MPELTDGTGKQFRAKVSSENRLHTVSINQLLSAERSRQGNLYGVGTGSINPTDSFSLGPVLWLRNDSSNQYLRVQKLIFGWDGGTTNFNRTILSFIKYNTSEPTGANTEIDDQVENVALSGSNDAVKSGKVKAHKWDGSGTGMTGSTGGFLQIPNRLAQGNTSIPIDGEIILGPGNSMEIEVTPQQTGLFNAAIVYYFENTDGTPI